MKDKVYLRIARTNRGYLYEVNKKKNHKPIDNQYKTFYPTIIIDLNIEIPDDYFKKSTAELNLKLKEFETATDIKVEEALK